MGEIVNLDVTTLEESVSVTTTDGGTVEVAVQAEKGDAATISVGTTTTGNAGTNASVTNSGTSSAAVFNFTIPRGDTGATGAQGPAGPNSVTSATTTNFTSGEVLFANSGVVGSVSRSGIDTRSEFPPSSHTHGNISNGGAIGTTADLVVVTGTSGVLTTQSRSGIDSRTTFPNDDVTAATAEFSNNTIVKRDANGGFDATFESRVLSFSFGGQIFLDTGGTISVSAGASISVDGVFTISSNASFSFNSTASANFRNALNIPPIVVSGNTTATAGLSHIVTSTATLTDPTPSEGAWFRVIVRNGTATVGGTAYSTSGTIIERSYHSGAWANRVYNETPVLGANVSTALSTAVGSAGAFVVNGGALGTPLSGTLTSCTGLPISTGVSGLASGIATFLATPSSANLAAALTDENGTGGGFVRAEGSTLTSTTLNGHALTTTSKYKSSDTTRSSNTFATDSDLTVSLAANSNYIIEIWLSGSVASAGGTLAIRAFYTGTLDAAITVGEVACVNSGSALAAAVFTWTSVSSPQVNMFESSTTNPRGNVFRFNLRTANAGDFELRWSNGNGAGTGSGSYTLHQGCSITATRIV